MLCIQEGLEALTELAHQDAKDSGWYTDLETGEPLERNVPEMIALCHSELSEALEGYRKGLMDDKLPHRSMIEVEIIDCYLRLADMAGYLNLDLGSALVEKIEFNRSRSDHKLENRKKEGGKKF